VIKKGKAFATLPAVANVLADTGISGTPMLLVPLSQPLILQVCALTLPVIEIVPSAAKANGAVSDALARIAADMRLVLDIIGLKMNLEGYEDLRLHIVHVVA
jgi:hypothetical protein